MNLYLLTLRDESSFEYDEPRAFIIAAASVKLARSIANRVATSGSTRSDPKQWLKPSLTRVKLLGEARPHIRAGVILAEAREG